MRQVILGLVALIATIVQPYAEAVTRPTGLSFLEPTAYQSSPLAEPLFSGSVPTAVELSPFPSVGDQGAQSSCVGWAVAYALKTYQEPGAGDARPARSASDEFPPVCSY